METDYGVLVYGVQAWIFLRASILLWAELINLKVLIYGFILYT